MKNNVKRGIKATYTRAITKMLKELEKKTFIVGGSNYVIPKSLVIVIQILKKYNKSN